MNPCEVGDEATGHLIERPSEPLEATRGEKAEIAPRCHHPAHEAGDGGATPPLVSMRDRNDQ